jgi:hypothetical protein
MNSLENINLLDSTFLLGYSVMLLVGLVLRKGSNTALLSFSFLVVLGIQSYFSTYVQYFTGVEHMWKYYCVSFLIDGLLFLYLSSKPSKELLPYLTAVCIMCFLSFVLMFETYFTIETTFVYYLYKIAIPTIHTYLLACLALGVGGVEGVCNNNNTGGASRSKTSKNSFGGIP